MAVPKLIVLTAPAAAGKTGIATFLEALGYVRLSKDSYVGDIIKEQSGKARIGKKDWHQYLTPEIEEEACRRIYRDRDAALAEGKGVIIDATSRTEETRNAFLATAEKCEKYLICLEAGAEELEKRRAANKGWNEEERRRWGDLAWEPPQASPEYELIVYRNTEPRDLGHIQEDLEKRFSRSRADRG